MYRKLHRLKPPPLRLPEWRLFPLILDIPTDRSIQRIRRRLATRRYPQVFGCKTALEHYSSSAVASPHLFTRLTVQNLSVAP